MVNYPVRCVCFLFVGILFLLPVIFLVVTVNNPKVAEHDEWRETTCTTDSDVNPLSCRGSKQVCATFVIQEEDSTGLCTFPCNGSGALLPLKRDDEIKNGVTVKCFYTIGGLQAVTTPCVVTNGEISEGCGTKTDEVFNDGVSVTDPEYQEGERPRRQTIGFQAPPGCVYVENDGIDGNKTSTITYAPNGTATMRCIFDNDDLLERLDYGGLAILLEGFFVTFSFISFVGVGLATFVEKTPNNDAYCFNFQL